MNRLKRKPNRYTVWSTLLVVLSALMPSGPQARAAQTAPPAAPVRIMPLGDSLTSSINGQASYRYWLWTLLQNAGYNVTFVGTQWGVGDGVSGTYPNFNEYHEGHPGATTRDILYGLSGWVQQDRPDVVLLLIGGNDFDQGFSISNALVNTYQIITTLRAENPKVVILWGALPPEGNQLPQEIAYNRGLSRLWRVWSTSASPIEPINLWTHFDAATDTVDGVHPNASGEQKFASRFYFGLQPVLASFGQYPKTKSP